MFVVSFVLIYLIGSALAVSPHNVDYFVGRSGDIIVQPDNAIIDNSAILLHGEQFKTITLDTIEDVHVADLFAHVMGTQPFNVLASRKGFPQGDLFNKPKASLLVTLDSIDPALFAKYSTWKDYQRVDLTTTAYPANTPSMLSNIATGTHASVHGIVGESWILPNGEKVEAHASNEGASLAANIPDIITQEWSGAPLTVSASSSVSMASAFAVNDQFASSSSYALFLNGASFENFYLQSGEPLSLSQQQLQAIFKDAAFSTFLGATTKIASNQITVSVRSAKATFNLADSTLFAELGFVYNLLNQLETDSSLSALVADVVPDFYSFVFSGLNDIRVQSGEQSDAFVVGLILVDNVIQQAVAKFDKLYGGRAVSAVACLNTQTVVSDELKKLIFAKTKNFLQNEQEFDLHFPSLYVKGEPVCEAYWCALQKGLVRLEPIKKFHKITLVTGNPGHVCSSVKAAVGNAVEVHCFESTYNWVEESMASPGNNTPPATPVNVAGFWIVFFLTIAIFLAVIVGVVGLIGAASDASKDSLLFRSAGRTHGH